VLDADEPEVPDPVVGVEEAVGTTTVGPLVPLLVPDVVGDVMLNWSLWARIVLVS